MLYKYITCEWYTQKKKLFSVVISLICTNAAGIFTHWPREKAQRKAFLETRQCIEARLKTQRENQQQVNIFFILLHFFCHVHVHICIEMCGCLYAFKYIYYVPTVDIS